ncbi:hypothetical protein PUN28_013180 [Cardiocondyla obscurior]|uniref:Uncharacterized protein n=1 Tax=Cardiocondyla obscurior TaxID=286306 RepID=A0AAW2F8M5_9HYME
MPLGSYIEMHLISATAYNRSGIFISHLSRALPDRGRSAIPRNEKPRKSCGCECVHQEIPRVSV